MVGLGCLLSLVEVVASRMGLEREAEEWEVERTGGV